MSIRAAGLRRDASKLSAGLPELLARAENLAASLTLGAHGRRRAGFGSEFWQYRTADFGDTAQDIDWRQSARSDGLFVRQMEFQVSQNVHIWVDQAQSMQFSDNEQTETKLERARLIALSLCIPLIRSGEKVGLMSMAEPAKTGRAQIEKIALNLLQGSDSDYGAIPQKQLPKNSHAIYFSDFLGDWESVLNGLANAADAGISGQLVQVLDPTEISFPFEGRTIFENASGSVSHETQRAGAIRAAYLDRLSERQDQLQKLARKTGWQYLCHITDQPAINVLHWLYTLLSDRARP